MASKLARFSWLPGGLAATVVLAIGRLIAPDSGLALETKLYDRIHRSAKVAPSADIVVVSIDRASIDKLGKWPWGFDVHATAIERLREAGASVIGWAVPFGSVANSADLQRIRDALSLLESSGFGNAEKAQELRQLLRAAAAGSSASAESRLAKAIQTHGRVVLPVELRLTREATTNSELPTSLLIGTNNAPRTMQAMQLRLPEESFLRAASAVGHLAFAADADGTVRSDTVAVRSGYDSIPSLAAAVATEALGLAPNDIVVNATSLRIGDRAIPLDSQQRMLPQYFPRAAFKELPFWRVWSGEVSSDELRGKIVLIGFPDAEISEAATLATPIGAHLPDVLAIASSTSSILDATYYSRPTSATAIEWFAMLAVVLAAAFLLPATGIAIGAVASAVIVAALGITEIGLLSSVRIWPQLALPAAAMVGGYFLYVVGELIRRANVRSSAQSKDSTASLRTLGQTFQRQGQLDLAFETYRRCPLDAPTMELLYQLGLDFERRRQNQRAAAVYGYIATRDPNYRDLRMRRARVKEDVEREVPRPRIETPAADPEPVRPQTRPPATSSRPGTRTLGRYEIEREIGKGAMGVVYLGRDPKINRVVAIKAIPLAEEFEEDDLEEARARFFREAEMAGRLNHPAIVTVYDAGEDQGLAYIAMEYLRGQHLSYYTDPARLLPPGTVLSLIARVADALHYAHRQNVVHRDIKPANIMFNSDTDELKITDFGIARLTDTSRTKTGIVLGTPSFMSPEQLEGRSLDGRSDQFALAVSLYQLLCGQLPFRAESMPRLMQKIATEPHPPIRSVRPELPECIEPILDRALAKSADDRYPTCAEFAAALRACAQQLAPPKRAQAEHEWLLP